jgi:formylglycine-generating enzyme required for sulfatase activity
MVGKNPFPLGNAAMTEESIFANALEQPAAARAAYLDAACAGDAALRRRLDAMLRAHARMGDFLERPAAEQRGDDSVTVTRDTPGALLPLAAPNSAPTQAGGRAGHEEVLAYLQPGGRPGSLGRLKHYEALEVLGKGAFGTVLKGFDDKLHRVVAIKVLAPQLAGSAPARQRFLREARAAAAIRHENVVGIYAVEEEPLPFLVMECVLGQTLSDKINREGQLGVKEVLRIGHQIACGLAAAHAQGLIHRDIKPANVLLENHVERVKITDFGLARANDDANLTQAGMVAGTPAYMSPEQAEGQPLDQRSDLFSLGSTLYALCTGRPAFRAANTVAVLKRVTEETPRPIRDLNPDIPAWLADLIARLHAKRPAERYQSAQEVADVLAQHLADLQLRGSAPPAGHPARPPAPVPARRRPAWPYAVAGALLVAAAAGVAIFFLNRGEEPAPSGHVQPPAPERRPTRPSLAVLPFDEAQAQAHQQAWVKYLRLPKEMDNTLGMKFRVIPPGKFLLAPGYEVTLTRPFAIACHEVTVGQFRAFVNETGHHTDAEVNGMGSVANADGTSDTKPEYTWRHPLVSQGNEFPVGQVSWDDAVAFCKWLSRKERKNYRLPTEAEWDWACRAGSAAPHHFGEDARRLGEFAWYEDNSGDRSQAVGQKKPNAWGLYDMHGNIAEYCSDWFADYPTARVTDPTGPADGDYRVIRSYSYRDVVEDVVTESRGCYSPHLSMAHFGFRVVLVLEE